MGSEHLPISNYDELSTEEITSKLEVILGNDPGTDLSSVIDYEASNKNRKTVIQKLKGLDSSDDIATGSGQEPQSESKPGPTNENTASKEGSGS